AASRAQPKRSTARCSSIRSTSMDLSLRFAQRWTCQRRSGAVACGGCAGGYRTTRFLTGLRRFLIGAPISFPDGRRRREFEPQAEEAPLLVHKPGDVIREVGHRLDGSPLAVMLDIDGTLAPIVPTPQNAIVPP